MSQVQTEIEIHTSDLTASCLRSVQLKHQGKIVGSYTTALYRGQLAGHVCAWIHQHNAWTPDGVVDAINASVPVVAQLATDERRPISDAVKANMPEIHEEVAKHIGHYVDRLKDYFSKCELIGCELPVRMTLDLPGAGPTNFASHLDLLFRDSHGQLQCWDWKWQDESPTMQYLGRNLQFVTYYLMLVHGEVLLDSDLGMWQQFGEFPAMAWVDLAGFKSYSRRTEGKDRLTGEVVVYAKGDNRPLDNIVRRWTFSPDREADMLKELSLRAVMMQHDIWPMSAEKIACFVCDSQRFCPAFHFDDKGTPNV